MGLKLPTGELGPRRGGGYLVLRHLAQSRRVANISLTTQDLEYQVLSPEDLVSNHLTDLNEADGAQLHKLGLAAY